jgi:glycosyltransferase involved in cell wall biosynthesis
VIAILLSTSNGAGTLPALLGSIHRQTHADWQLLVRDDGSADPTQRVLTVAASRDRRIVPVRDWEGPQGRCGSFGLLMRRAHATEARYFAFADQDDVWLPQKLERQLALMRELESAHGSDVPLLVHSDLRLVDARLEEVHPSLARYLGFRRGFPAPAALRTLLAQNFVTGCAAVFNRPLLSAAMPLPAEAASHDWWLALCAAATGHIGYLPEAMVHYRLHRENTKGRIGSRLRIRRWLRAHRHLARGAAQAGALGDRLRERSAAASPPIQVLDQYAALFRPTTSRWRRSWGVARLGAGRPGPLNRLLFAGAAALSRDRVRRAA